MIYHGRMGLKDLLLEALTGRVRPETAKSAAKEVLENETAREMVGEVLRSDAAKDFAKEAARRAVDQAGERVKEEARGLLSPITDRLEARKRRIEQEKTEKARRDAIARREQEIDDELEAIKKKLGKR